MVLLSRLPTVRDHWQIGLDESKNPQLTCRSYVRSLENQFHATDCRPLLIECTSLLHVGVIGVAFPRSTELHSFLMSGESSAFFILEVQGQETALCKAQEYEHDSKKKNTYVKSRLAWDVKASSLRWQSNYSSGWDAGPSMILDQMRQRITSTS